ncbi:MAG TPA: indolepyruvate ferredoxin oxidoreductase family protein [Gaiellaceae bacterium]|nr:indolepyruvate ferredoxin oxidoreductase family protein [Gaiellaceae bacterium]
MTSLLDYSLEDKYGLATGRVYLSGLQALVRVPVDRHRADASAGLRTATFVSGYPGSPLGGFDLELARQRSLLQEHDIQHNPGLNEELAATAVGGSQLASTWKRKRYDGVVGIWYGKAPGLDRASDAIRHANFMGTHRNGGVLAVVGDDPLSKSSTLPSASEATLYALLVPTLYPADAQDVLDLGLHGIALSRSSGLWVGMKMATAVADGFGSVDLDPARLASTMVTIEPHDVTGMLVAPITLELERSLMHSRLETARLYAYENGLNRITRSGPGDRVGIVAAGKTYLDVRQALAQLGFGDAELAACGIRLLRLAMPFPLEPRIVREFATGLEEIVVVEEKRAFVEVFLKDVLYASSERPRVVGKRDEADASLIPDVLELDPDLIAVALGPRLHDRFGLPATAARLERLAAAAGSTSAPIALRTPYFCSGCPHNTSMQTPEGTLVGAGIGCHGLVLQMPAERVGQLTGITQMGGEGAQWAGIAPFVEDDRFVQNLGDGTFFHSGSLSVRAAVAAGVDLTFKILHNSAVAMTGGQSATGALPVPQLTRLLESEGVKRTIVTTDDLSRYRGVTLADNSEVWGRERIVEAQRELAEVRGVTALIHDQECAAERRRKRRRGKAEDPPLRVLINERVCEGCGDCGAKSNCLSVQPVETEFGRKTQIHQSSCNKDYSCLAGDCPSFVTVVPGTRRPPRVAPEITADALPAPERRALNGGFTMRLTGIGGTGVVTVSQLVATAALLDGLSVRGLDQTGLAQKGGGVVSDVKLFAEPLDWAGKATTAECDLYLVADLIVGADPRQLSVADPERTVAVVSTTKIPTGQMVADVAATFPEAELMLRQIQSRTRGDASVSVDAQGLTRRLLGSDQSANVLLLGAAYQTGALPVSADAIERAIELNRVAVAANLQAFRRGRQVVADPEAVQRELEALEPPPAAAGATPAERELVELVRAEEDSELRRLVDMRVSDLVRYQDAAYARRYAELVERVRAAEADAGLGSALAEAVAFNLYKLMAFKDEYEVARLHLDPAFQARIEREFGEGARIAYQLHPPILRALGLKRKLSLGRWVTPFLRLLRAMRRLRGTRLDVFGYSRIRRLERELVAEYRGFVEAALPLLSAERHDQLVQLASAPDIVRGYEQIKLDSVSRYRERVARLREALVAEGATATAA